jgi:hypothetical protein
MTYTVSYSTCTDAAPYSNSAPVPADTNHLHFFAHFLSSLLVPTDVQRFLVIVTGDHSTPVLFGDHSFEPVPFTVAHVSHVVGVVLSHTYVPASTIWLQVCLCK